jgi:hypothetical protein
MAQPDFRAAKTTHDGPPHINHYITAAGETFSRGQVVAVTVATGHVAEASTDDVSLLGIAMADADIGNAIPVMEFTPGLVLSARNTGTAFVLATHGNALCNLEVTAGVHGAEVGQTNAAAFKILGRDDTEPSTVVGTERVLVSVLSSVMEGTGGDKTPV